MNEKKKTTADVQFPDILKNLERHVSFLRDEGCTHIELFDSSAPEAGRALLKINTEISECMKCVLHKTRKNTVPGCGCPNPDIMFVGEAPGADEDAAGLPFVGRAGALLTRLITRIGYTRDKVFIANILKCRPPDNRNPAPDEIELCIPYLKRQISIIQPKIIVALGAISARALTGLDMEIGKMRGKWFTFEGIDLMPTYHPAYLLRGSKQAFWNVWNDMLQVLNRLGKEPPEDSRKQAGD